MQYEGHANKGGVYKLVNTLNGRFYIGSCKGFKQRWSQHLAQLENGKHHNQFLLNDYRKCGPAAFEVVVLEVIDGDQLLRLAREQELLDNLYDNQTSCYNLSPYAKSPAGAKQKGRKIIDRANWGMTGKKHSEAAKAKMSASKLGRQTGSAHHMHGKSHTEKAKQKNAAAHTGSRNYMYGRKQTFESNEKRRLSRSRPVEQLTKEGNLVASFIGAKAASEATGIHHSAIINCVNGKAKSAGGFVWRRKS